MQTFQPFGLQTGTNDPSERSSYATSMVYNRNNQEITITGGTFSDYFHPGVETSDEKVDSDCFVAVQHLKDPSRLSWVRRRQYGVRSSPEFCSDIHARKGGRHIVIGHSGENGILSNMLPNGNIRRSIYGMVLNINQNVDLAGGILLHSNEVQYPVAVTTNESGDEIFVAEIFSDMKPDTFHWMDMLNVTLEGNGRDASASAYSIPISGLNFSIRLKKYTSPDTIVPTSTVFERLSSEWSREYGTLGMANVQVSTLDYISSSTLVMTGFTRGEGEAFGNASYQGTGTLDSFIVTVDPTTGQRLKSMRIESVEPGDDKILGTCLGNNSTDFYIVGMTGGIFDSTYLQPQNDLSTEHRVYAFIQKIDLNDMSVVWSRQLGAIIDQSTTNSVQDITGPQIHGLACAVTPDDEEIFLGGNVRNGAELVLPSEESFVSAGGTDIFVAKFTTNDGNLVFAAQIGSSGDDSLATRKSLSTDSEGNLIILGNTNGPMFRDKLHNATTDIFTMSVGRSGGDFLFPFDSTSRKTDADLSTFQAGSFFKHRNYDTVEDANYENVMSMTLVFFCLLFIVLFTTTIYFVRRGKEREKSKAVGEASTTICWSGHENSDGDSIHFPMSVHGTSTMCNSFGSQKKKHSAFPRSVYPPLEAKEASIVLSKETKGTGRYFGFDTPKFPDDLGAIRSIVGNRRANKTFLSTGKPENLSSWDTKRNRSFHPDAEAKKKENESSLYEEIYDLLSLASARLGVDLDDESDRDPPTKRSPSARTKLNHTEEMTLDNIWDMEFV